MYIRRLSYFTVNLFAFAFAAIERLVTAIVRPFIEATGTSVAFAVPQLAPRTLGECWTGVRIDRHEAGVSRRSAARNV